MKISHIKEKLNSGNFDNNFLLMLKNDSRKGVQSLLKSYEKKLENKKKEEKRIEKLKEIENIEYENRFIDFIAGVDEVGRGPLAGPVVTAAVILDKNSKILHINDSKKLSEQLREKLYDIIKEEAISYSITVTPPEIIDRYNILNATYISMRESINSLDIEPDLVLVDGNSIPNLKITQKAIFQGDSKSYSIAAASILAKVTRDRIMVEYDSDYPEYGFKSHKGYGTKLHLDMIKKFGPCEIHRASFAKVIYEERFTENYFLIKKIIEEENNIDILQKNLDELMRSNMNMTEKLSLRMLYYRKINYLGRINGK